MRICFTLSDLLVIITWIWVCLLADMACDPTQSADVGAVIMQEGLAHICLVTPSMTLVRAKVEHGIPRKRKGFCQQHDKGLIKFYDAVMQGIIRHVDFDSKFPWWRRECTTFSLVTIAPMVNPNIKCNPKPNPNPNPNLNPYPTLNWKPNHDPHSNSLLSEISLQEQLLLEQCRITVREYSMRVGWKSNRLTMMLWSNLTKCFL